MSETNGDVASTVIDADVEEALNIFLAEYKLPGDVARVLERITTGFIIEKIKKHLPHKNVLVDDVVKRLKVLGYTYKYSTGDGLFYWNILEK